jgi:hypothetical protein
MVGGVASPRKGETPAQFHRRRNNLSMMTLNELIGFMSPELAN